MIKKRVNGAEDLLKIPTINAQTLGQMLNFAYFLKNTTTEIQLITIERFTEKACNQKQLVTLNTFEKSTMKWKTPLNVQEKFKNFHNCMLNSYTFLKSLYSNVLKSVDHRPRGILNDIIRAVAGHGNFSLYFQFINERTGDLLAINGIILKPTIFQQITSIKDFFLNSHVTSTFADYAVIFVVTPSEKLTSYQKILKPFDSEIWKFLLITFGVAFSTVFVINRMPKVFQDLIFGRGVQSPSYNILGSFFGISQSRVPVENTARILLIFFVYFCLIFRTAYQGKDDLNN